ncbi:MAG: PAS domain-containing protein, partial [Bacteroidia bacterium]
SKKKLNQISLFDFLDEEHKKIALERTILASKGIDAPQITYPITNLKGEKKYVNLTTSPVVFNGKNLSQLIFQDVTKEYLLEQEKQKIAATELHNKELEIEIKNRIAIEEELIKTKNYLKSIIDSSLDIISASDKNGNIIELNKAGLKTFGYSKEEIIGKQIDILFSIITDQAKIIKELFTKGYYKGEVINKRKNGEEFISFLSASVLRNQNGEVIGTMGVSRDITELKKQEELIQKNQDELIQQSSRLRAIF